MIHKVGLETGGAVINLRAEAAELISMIGGKQIHPVCGLPGGVSTAVTKEQQERMVQITAAQVEFAKFSLQLFDDVVLGNNDYVDLIKSDAFTHETYYMGMVDENNKVNFYDGKIRVTGPDGAELVKFEGKDYLSTWPSTSSPTATSSTRILKAVGWKGFVDGKDSGVYRASPLSRLNASDGMATPLAQAEYERFYSTLGGKPVHATLATHWARLVELLYAAERAHELATDPDLTEPRRAHDPDGHRRRGRRRGRGAARHPLPPLQDRRQGHRHQRQPHRRDDEQQRRHLDVAQEGRRRPDQGRHRDRRRHPQHDRDGLPRLRPVLRLRHPHAARRHAARGRDQERGDGRGHRERQDGTCDVSSTLVLGMGNPILSDDGVGLYVAERLQAGPMPDGVEVQLSEVAGLRLLELVKGYDKVVIVDALRSGREPGEIVRYEAREFKGGHRYGSAHSIGLHTALELGRQLGMPMPEDVTVFAVEAEDIETFGEEFSPPVAAAAEKVIDLVRAEVGAG